MCLVCRKWYGSCTYATRRMIVSSLSVQAAKNKTAAAKAGKAAGKAAPPPRSFLPYVPLLTIMDGANQTIINMNVEGVTLLGEVLALKHASFHPRARAVTLAHAHFNYRSASASQMRRSPRPVPMRRRRPRLRPARLPAPNRRPKPATRQSPETSKSPLRSFSTKAHSVSESTKIF